jgi:hypothetical protein
VNNPASLKNEFVLDENGQCFTRDDKTTSLDYVRFFSVYDIYQGWLGNCFHVGAMMALTKNEQLLEFVVPPDNALRENMNYGAYHFRFWKLGDWYDVVVDDFLPVNKSYELIFSHNKTYPNEFWVSLFEKAFAKFIGSYDELESSLFEDSAMFLSGGIFDSFRTDLALKKTVDCDGPNLWTELTGAEDAEPNADELFDIVRIALAKKDMCGGILEDYEIEKRYGFHKEHFYIISQLFVDTASDNSKYVKVHSPFNEREKLKKYLIFF